VYLVAAGGTTPFVVAGELSLGGLVFLLARFAGAGLHELAHGLTVASFGRQVAKAGFKSILIFPYVFVDTSDAWFEPRRRRLAVSAAGPVCDSVLGGTLALLALLAGSGGWRDIFFQAALAAYVGAFLNLNPFLDRDGYHLLVDLLREPGLRRRSREALARRLAGRAKGQPVQRVELVYAISALGWSSLGGCFAIIVTIRYYDELTARAPREVVWVLLGTFYLLMFAPVVLAIVRPLADRWRRRPGSAEGVPA
jgi:putative peptide zinc metalloprotease protein